MAEVGRTAVQLYRDCECRRRRHHRRRRGRRHRRRHALNRRAHLTPLLTCRRLPCPQACGWSSTWPATAPRAAGSRTWCASSFARTWRRRTLRQWPTSRPSERSPRRHRCRRAFGCMLGRATHATLCPRRPLHRIAIRSAVRALTNYLVYSASECVRCGPAASARPPCPLPRRRSPLRRAALPLARQEGRKDQGQHRGLRQQKDVIGRGQPACALLPRVHIITLITILLLPHPRSSDPPRHHSPEREK